MALEKQIQIYDIDTRNFYSNHEERLHALNQDLKSERNRITYILKDIVKKLKDKHNFSDDDIKSVSKGKYEYDGTDSDVIELLNQYQIRKAQIDHKAKLIKQSKSNLQQLLENKVQANIDSGGKHHTRVLSNRFDENKVISVFDSSFTRMIGAKPNVLSEDFMVVQVFFFNVAKDLIYHGFTFKGEKYIYFTSSAGQIRTKKCVFIKESVYKQHEKTMMCGLTIDTINAKGGNNPNKHLAYLALNNSATDLWEDFDIDKAIVIEDFETNVFGTYDFVDESDYSITRKQGDIPITHTDGAGMMLPCMGKNRQVRLPWIKGLLGVFDFVRFIEENNCVSVIKDIYGKEHDVIAEGIQIILTKSMFKMWKYYDSWEQYKEYYKKYGCTAAYANIEKDRPKNATINYQMLQSLTDITDDEIEAIADKSVTRIKTICDSVDNVKLALGVSVYNDMSPWQRSLQIYTNLLADSYVTSQLKETKDSWVKNAKAGKLRIKGKYSFVLPDFYAACEYWFCDIKNPKGLLADGEVFCWLARRVEKVDCLRSPHLYREHAIRTNIAYSEFEDRQKNLREWFATDAIYTSCHDLISKMLQFDVDGDTLLVVTDETLVNVAERNMKDIVPLYYDMKKASSIRLTNASIWQGLNASFTGKSIGSYSNSISKIWNSEVFLSGTDEEKQEALDVIKLLCMENNFCIDAAKTLYMPERPQEVNEKIKKYTVTKLPAFFVYAKDKLDEQTADVNGSFVNKLASIIPNPRIAMKKLDINKPDFKLLMRNPKIECNYEYKNGKIVEDKTDPLILAYLELQKNTLQYIAVSQIEDIGDKKNEMSNEAYTNFRYGAIINDVKSKLSVFGYSEQEVADILVKFSYERNQIKKGLLWLCYGGMFYNNLEKNLKGKSNENSVYTNLTKKKYLFHVELCTKRIEEYTKKYKHEQNKIAKGKCNKTDIQVKCKICGGETFVNKTFIDKSVRCPKCEAAFYQRKLKMLMEEYSKKEVKVAASIESKTKEVQCVDCGEWFYVNKKDTRSCRCNECKIEHLKILKKKQNRRAYQNRKDLNE